MMNKSALLLSLLAVACAPIRVSTVAAVLRVRLDRVVVQNPWSDRQRQGDAVAPAADRLRRS